MTMASQSHCPNCGAELAADGPCEVFAEVRNSVRGLRVDVQFECPCGTQLLLEDAGEGVIGEAPERSTAHFKGEEFRV